MGENSEISWTHHTFNPWRGCTKVSSGCINCYAEQLAKRNPRTLGIWGPNGTRAYASESYWREPLRWNRDAQEAGERRRVFCASLADVCEDHHEILPSWRARLGQLILDTPWLDWLLLTKRPENILRFVPDFWVTFSDDFILPPNVWIGTTVENQAAADERIPLLEKVPAAVRFLSCEPLLEFVDLFGHLSRGNIHWLIVGGESGANARPMHPEWARILRDQSFNTGVKYHFKQWGHWLPIDQPWTQDSIAPLKKNERWMNVEGGHGFHGEQVWRMRAVGKEAAGRELDGQVFDEFPVTEKATY